MKTAYTLPSQQVKLMGVYGMNIKQCSVALNLQMLMKIAKM